MDNSLLRSISYKKYEVYQRDYRATAKNSRFGQKSETTLSESGRQSQSSLMWVSLLPDPYVFRDMVWR